MNEKLNKINKELVKVAENKTIVSILFIFAILSVSVILYALTHQPHHQQVLYGYVISANP